MQTIERQIQLLFDQKMMVAKLELIFLKRPVFTL